MKFNYKRIASILTGAVMLSSTIAIAAAANFPAPFADNAANTAIVYGSMAQSLGTTDITAAGRISAQIAGTQLSNVITNTVTSDTTVEGESEPVELSSQKLYLGDVMNVTKTYFDDGELPVLLKDQEINDKDGNAITVSQTIYVPNSAIGYAEPDSDNDAVLIADFDNGEEYKLKVTFSPPVNINRTESKSITLFGKPYTFSGDTDELTKDSVTVVGKSDAVRISSGETTTVNGHSVSVDVEDGDNAVVTIDGESEDVEENGDYRIADVDVYVQNIFSQNYAGGSNYVNLYFGSEKVTFEDGEEVQFGTDGVDGTDVAVEEGTLGKVKSITVTVTPNILDDKVEGVVIGDSFIDPVFGSVKFAFVSATPDLEDDSREQIVIKATSDTSASLVFTNAAGNEYDLDLFKPGEVAGANVTLGVDEFNVSTAPNTNITLNEFVVTCDGEYTQIWEITDVDLNDDATSTVTFTDLGDDDEQQVDFDTMENGETGTFDLADGTPATVTLSNNVTEDFTVSRACNFLITEQGANISLAGVSGSTTAASVVRISEETEYNADDFDSNDGTVLGTGQLINVTLDQDAAAAGREMTVDVDVAGYSDVLDDSDDTYYLTRYGTFVKATGEDDITFTAYYSEEAMALGFYIGEASATTNGGDDGGEAGQALLASDTETAKYAGKHLIVVGGSCVNTVAAKLLGSTTPLCTSAFTTASGIGPNEYLIKTFANPDAPGKIATLVAGYEAADTTQAVDYLLTQSPSTAVGDAYETGTKLTVSAG
jgi:hypothetical protein